MLKNKKERQEYIDNDDNWLDLKEANKHLEYRVLNLKETNIYKVQLLYYNRYIGYNWYTIGTYETNDKGELNHVSSFTENQLIDRLKEL